jgi:DNA-binding LytR/AlgR family response regulator
VFAYFFIFWSALDLLFYGLILAVAHGDRFRQRYESGERRVAELERALGDASRATEPPADDRFDYLSFVDAGRRQVIPVRQVRWIEADGYYAGLHTDAGKFLIRESLNALSAKLAPDSFIRVHRSTIVNLDYVKSYGSDDSDGWSVTLADGTRRRVSRSGRRRLKDKFR